MSATEDAAQDAGTIPCHCIIAHPDKPKFLVIRHTDRWSPPILHVPESGSLMYKPAIINNGMMQKYSLRTSVLRIVVEMKNYALIELELHASSQQQMQAVWVGREEYVRFRSLPEGEDDPLENWLEEREKGTVPPQRPSWLRPGWYRQAEQWLTDRLIEQGIQARGSVQQFKAGWPTACLLRVSTVQGQVYFKAAYDKPPGEARLTRVLSEQWPNLVAPPLAIDEERNWMVLRDYKLKKDGRPPADSYPHFAAALGRFQVDAMQHLGQWRDMSCPVMDHDYLSGDDGRLESLLDEVEPWLAAEPMPMDGAQLENLKDALGACSEASAALAAYGISDSLSHLDFRADNFFFEDGECRVIDWADVAICHPFMAMCQCLVYLERQAEREPEAAQAEPLDETLRERMKDAYLSAFTGLLPAEKLNAAFDQAQAVFPMFWFLYLASQMRVIESNTPAWNNLNSLLHKQATLLMDRHADGS